jgi:hypothetical protein
MSPEPRTGEGVYVGYAPLEVLDQWDIFRQVVELADFESGDKRLCELEVGGRRVRWKVVGKVIAIGLAEEFSAPRNSDDAQDLEIENGL